MMISTDSVRDALATELQRRGLRGVHVQAANTATPRYVWAELALQVRSACPHCGAPLPPAGPVQRLTGGKFDRFHPQWQACGHWVSPARVETWIDADDPEPRIASAVDRLEAAARREREAVELEAFDRARDMFWAAVDAVAAGEELPAPQRGDRIFVRGDRVTVVTRARAVGSRKRFQMGFDISRAPIMARREYSFVR
jgi:hypothetical protein